MNHLAAETTDLKSRAVKGGAVTMAGQGAKFVLTFGSTVILARLLDPADFGLLAMVSAITGFVALVKDLGLSMAIVQRQEISQAQVSALFWINVIASIVLAAITCAIAPLVAAFYGEPRLIPVTIALTAGLVFGGFTQQHQALLRRRLRFGALAAVEVAAMAGGVGVGIAGALAGLGYWSLVLMNIANPLINAVAVWIACPWRPSLPRRKAGVREMLAFGGDLTGFNIVNYFARNLDNVLVGRFSGADALGIYSRAYNLLMQPLSQINGPLTAVALPALSRVAREPERFRRAYLQLTGAIALVTMPAIAFLIPTADWVIELALGKAWIEAGTVFALLAIVGLVQPVTNTSGWLFVAEGRTREMLHAGLIGSTLAVASFFVGLPWGAAGVAASYAISGLVIRTPLLLWFAGRRGAVRTAEIYKALVAPAVASLAVLGSVFALRWALQPGPIAGLALAAPLSAAVTLLVLGIQPAGRRGLQDVKDLAKPLLERRRIQATPGGAV